MKKNILILSASPRKGGNSDLLCDQFAKGATEAGHDVEKIRLAERKIGYCLGCTPAQVILRWHVQTGFAVIPGSRNVDHIRDNLAILDFTLTDADMAALATLDKGVRYYTRTDAQLAQFAAWRPAYETA